ncbi:MAG: hypothetical protein AB8B50_04405 [Pirellulaceae bacterium]
MNLSEEELKSLGFASVGRDVKVHRSALIYGAENISLGDYSRIDCFCMLSAGESGIKVGKCVHIAAGCYLYGAEGTIQLDAYSGLSSRVSIYTATDDYVDGYMTNPTVPEEFRKVKTGSVHLHRHVVVGASSVVLPGVELKEGASVAALTLVNKDVGAFEILASKAAAARVIGRRGRKLLELEKQCDRRLDGKPQ